MLEEGGHSKVYLVRHKQNGSEVAMKKVGSKIKKDIENVINEAKLMASLDGDELMSCFDLYFYNKIVYVMLEYMELGSMTKIVTKYHR